MSCSMVGWGPPGGSEYISVMTSGWFPSPARIFGDWGHGVRGIQGWFGLQKRRSRTALGSSHEIDPLGRLLVSRDEKKIILSYLMCTPLYTFWHAIHFCSIRSVLCHVKDLDQCSCFYEGIKNLEMPGFPEVTAVLVFQSSTIYIFVFLKAQIHTYNLTCSNKTQVRIIKIYLLIYPISSPSMADSQPCHLYHRLEKCKEEYRKEGTSELQYTVVYN